MVKKIITVSLSDSTQLHAFLKDELFSCIKILQAGGTIVFPTETLYGLGVDIYNETAIENIIRLKGRPKSLPIAVAVSNLSQVERIAKLSDYSLRLIKYCIPKPITILLPVQAGISHRLTSGSKLIGIRFPDNIITKAILDNFGPITATSANIHGTINPATIEPVIEQFNDEVDIYINTGPCQFGIGSTVLDPTGDTIKIIRDGACSGAEIEECLKNIRRS